MFFLRWDVYRSNYLGNEAACLCPATETTCAKDRKCWWYEVGWSRMKIASWRMEKWVYVSSIQLPDDTNGLMPSYACLNNAERFYYLLEKLLKKRGKNDFAIKIKYTNRTILKVFNINVLFSVTPDVRSWTIPSCQGETCSRRS